MTGASGFTGPTGPAGPGTELLLDNQLLSFTSLTTTSIQYASANTTIPTSRSLWLNGYAVVDGSPNVIPSTVLLDVCAGTSTWEARGAASTLNGATTSGTLRIYYTYSG